MAGSTNFQQWNPTAANQETDTQYTADPLRAGGAALNNIFGSRVANKLFYQLAIFVAAFAQALANKGFNVSDSNFAALVAVLTSVKTTADFVAGLVNVPFTPTPTFNAANSNGFSMVLTGNVTLGTIINYAPGQTITMVVYQDSVGGRTFAFPTNMLSPGIVDPTPFAVSIQQFFVGLDGSIRPLTGMTVS